MIWVMSFEDYLILLQLFYFILFFKIRLLSFQLHDFCRFDFYKVIPILNPGSRVSQIKLG